MTSTTDEHVSTSRGACVFCNTTRPVEQVLCPSCGRGWIDTSAVDSVDSVVKAEAEAIRTITTGEALPVRRSTYRRGWWLPLVVAAVVFGAYWGVVSVVDGDGTTPTTTPAAAPTTLAPTTTAPVAAPPTTLPAPTTTTVPTTTTSSTTTTLPPLAIGEAIPLDELKLGAVELGPLAFGTAADDVLPDLAATFGQPTSISEATPAWGLCAGDTGRVLTFGGLHIVTVDDAGTERLAGFVVEAAGAPTDELQTFSGVRLGSTIGDLSDTYRSVSIDAGTDATTWIVTSVNDGRTLLWGTARGSADEAVIDRIASPNSCDGGPDA